MRTLPAALQTTLETDSMALAVLVKLTRPDGGIIALTTWGRDLIVNLDGGGAISYSPTQIEGISTFSAQINGAIDDSELTAGLETEFAADDIRRQFFAGTVVKVGYVVPTDLANPWLHRVYEIGRSQVEGARVRMELLGPERRLEAPVGRPLTANCPWDFGSAECGVNTDVTAWSSATAYALGAERKPVAGGKLWFRATVAGTSGGGEPAWAAGTVIDGGVTWTSFNARRIGGTVATVTGGGAFTASGINIAADWFAQGLVIWLSGDNAGEKQRIHSDGGAGAITQRFSCLDAILVGDTFTLVAGCRKRLSEDCVAKHQNAAVSSSRTLRFGGFQHLAPENVTASAPVDSET